MMNIDGTEITGPTIYRSERPLPASLLPSTWGIPNRMNPWEIANGLAPSPWEIFHNGEGDYYITVNDNDFLAKTRLKESGCLDAASIFVSAGDAGLAGHDGNVQCQHGRAHVGVGRAAAKFGLMVATGGTISLLRFFRR